MSSRVTDRALEALPAQSLRELHLVCCEGVHGTTIARLDCLEVLRLSSCRSIAEEAIQVKLSHCDNKLAISVSVCVYMQCTRLVHVCLSCSSNVVYEHVILDMVCLSGQEQVASCLLSTVDRERGAREICTHDMQVIAASCRRLKIMELPLSMPWSCLPAKASEAGHLSGLRVEGGKPSTSWTSRRYKH